jgi:hypothetical protein
MRKITFILLALFFSTIGFGQSSDPFAEFNPNSNPTPNPASSKGAWTIQFNHGGIPTVGSAGAESDGTYFYVTQWNGTMIWKYNLSGVKIDSFSIPSVSGLRDLAYDGTYFYGGAAGLSIYKMDFNSTPPSLVSTISSPVAVRHIAYNPSADNGNGGFYVGNWSTDIKLVSRTGATLQTIPAATHGLTNSYGSAYDTISAGGPYIWLASASTHLLTQLNATTGVPTGLVHDLIDVDPNGGYGGGLFIQENIVSGTVTLGGLIQNTAIYGYDLATTASDSFDLEMTSLNIPNLIPINQNTNIAGEITNQGSQTITSYTLNYSVDNGTTVTDNVTGVSIASYQTVNFTHSTPYVATSGMHNIKVWVSNPNGVADQNPTNDTLTTQATGYDPTSSVQRMPLYETFTSSTCSPCVAGNANMQSLFDANPNKWVCVKYQMSWPSPGDPYYTDEGGVRRAFYSVNSVPRQEIDGGYDGNSSSVTQADFDAAYANPAFMSINADLTLGGHMVTVDYTVTPKIDFPANAKLYIAIVEKTTYNNTGSNGETSFHWVMKKMLPNASGTTIGPLTANSAVTNSIVYSFNGSYRLPNSANDPINHTIEHSVEDFNNLLAVVWVQNPATLEVYQSTLSTFTLGMDSKTASEIIKNVYPNPANDNVNVELNIPQSENLNISIVNNMGQVVDNYSMGNVSGSQNYKLDISKLSSGIYFINIQIGDKKYSKPIQVQ